MIDNLKIVAFCSIETNSISINGSKEIIKDKELPFGDFSKQIYKELDLSYPKFFKMDNLCKLSFLTAEILLQNVSISEEEKNDMAIVLSNKSASLDTDRKHQETINDSSHYFPSPALFVYTLPNITIGEISIRHKVQGENAFFVSDEINFKLLHQYSSSLYLGKKGKHILCGWVEFDGDQYRSFMYLVAEKGTYDHTEIFIKNIYNKN